MIPIYQDPHFSFCFADDREIQRFHLADLENGQHVTVVRIDPATLQPLSLLTEATVGVDGWVDLSEPIHVRAGDAFIVVPTPAK